MDTKSYRPPDEDPPGQHDPCACPETITRRVTQRDVAAAAGVHSTTVSLALCGSSKISPITRDRVRRIAASIGFVPDPLIGAFVAHRERVSGRSCRETTAFITCGAFDDATKECFGAARTSAEASGFRMDHLVVDGTRRSQQRLAQILFHRGISATILCCPAGCAGAWRGLSVDRMSVAVIGSTDGSLPFHRVEIDYVGGVRVALRRARQMGWRRIGLVAAGSANDPWKRALATGALSAPRECVADVCALRMATPSGTRGNVVDESDVAELARWLRVHQPEVIICVARQVQPYLRALGLRTPRDVMLLDLDRAEFDTETSGIVHSRRAIGTVAFGVLHRLVRENIRGIPSVATRTRIDGRWCSGVSKGNLS